MDGKYCTTPFEAKVKTLLEAYNYKAVNAPNGMKDGSAEMDVSGKSAEEIAALMHQEIRNHAKAMTALSNMDWHVQFNIKNARQLFWSIEAFLRE